MKTLERFIIWMEKNLEQPFYQAEVTRAEVVRGGVRRHNKRAFSGMRHGKLALRATK